ncbi:MAG: HEPN domain-containing protein [Armatimonadota bacterium]|nr:HEPN domain-containing protein [Armatimonadota bacterium]
MASGFYEWACLSAHQAAEKAVKAAFQKLHGEGWLFYC